MQQLLSCVSLTGNPCCEYPYSLSGADCVRQCLENYYASILNQKDTDWFVASKFGIQDAECLSSRKILDIKRLIDLLVILFEEAENRVVNGLTPLSMSEIWEENGLRCIVTSMRRKYGLNLVNAFAMAGITDPVGNPVPTNTTIPVPGSYSCGIGPAPDPDGPEPPEPSCFITPDAIAESLDCSATLNSVFVAGVGTPDISEGLYVPGDPPSGYPDAPSYWLNGVVLFGQESPTPGEYYWNITTGDGFTTYPVSSTSPWDNPNWHDTFGDGSIHPVIRQGLTGDACDSESIIVRDSGESDSNGIYSAGPPVPFSMAGTIAYYKGNRYIYASSQVGSDYIWSLCQGSISNVRFRTDAPYPSPVSGTWEVGVGTGPAPEVVVGSPLDFLVPAPIPEAIYALTCCDVPVFATYDEDTGSWDEFIFPAGFILQVSGIPYVDIGSGPGMLFPSMALTLIGPGPTTYYIESSSPQTAQNREVRVQGLVSGVWTDIWSGNENVLPQVIEILGTVPSIVRAFYEVNGCENVSPSIVTNPPPGGCGTLIVSTIQSQDCIEGTFQLQVVISTVSAFPLGDMIVRNEDTILQVIPAALGSYDIGPFPFNFEITIEIENSAFPECSYHSDTYTSTCGDPDPEFDDGGLNNYVQVLQVQSDGAILVGGAFTFFGSTPANRFTRLNMNGTLDDDYNTNMGSGLDNAVLGIEIDAFGRAVVCGFFTTANGLPYPKIVRFNTDGTVDETFVVGTGFSGSFGYCQDMTIMPDGTIICGGAFTHYNGTPANDIIALNPDGSINVFWDFGTGFNGLQVQEIEADADGNILVASTATQYNGVPCRPLTRLFPGGVLDASFLPQHGGGNGILILPDGRILCAGAPNTVAGVFYPGLVCANPDGTLDTSFMNNLGTFLGNWSYQDVAMMSDGNGVLLSGQMFGLPSGPQNVRLVRILLDGTPDTNFDTGVGPNAICADAMIDPVSGGMIVVGFFTQFDTLTRLRVVRLNW